MREALARRGIDGETVGGNGTDWTVRWLFPPSMTGGERRNVSADLKNGPADPPFAEPPRPDEGEVGQ